MNLSRRDKAPTGEAAVEAVNGEAVVVNDRRAAGFVAQLASFVCRCVAVVDKGVNGEAYRAEAVVALSSQVERQWRSRTRCSEAARRDAAPGGLRCWQSRLYSYRLVNCHVAATFAPWRFLGT